MEGSNDMKEEWIVREDTNPLPNPDAKSVKIIARNNAISMRAVDNDAEDPTAMIQRVILPKTMKVLPWHTFFILSLAIACS